MPTFSNINSNRRENQLTTEIDINRAILNLNRCFLITARADQF